MEIITGLLCIWFFFLGYMLCRNEWVKKQQIKLLYKASDDCKKETEICFKEKLSGAKREWPDIGKYIETHFEKKYYNYNKMLYTFWIWDVEKMRYY